MPNASEPSTREPWTGLPNAARTTSSRNSSSRLSWSALLTVVLLAAVLLARRQVGHDRRSGPRRRRTTSSPPPSPSSPARAHRRLRAAVQHAPDAGQNLGPLSTADVGGVRIPIDTAQRLRPRPAVDRVPPTPPSPTALTPGPRRDARPADEPGPRPTARRSPSAPDGDSAKVAAGDYGPVPADDRYLLADGRSGGLDGALTAGQLLPDRLHQAAAVPRRRRLPRGPGAPRRTWAATSGA